MNACLTYYVFFFHFCLNIIKWFHITLVLYYEVFYFILLFFFVFLSWASSGYSHFIKWISEKKALQWKKSQIKKNNNNKPKEIKRQFLLSFETCFEQPTRSITAIRQNSNIFVTAAAATASFNCRCFVTCLRQQQLQKPSKLQYFSLIYTHLFPKLPHVF